MSTIGTRALTLSLAGSFPAFLLPALAFAGNPPLTPVQQLEKLAALELELARIKADRASHSWSSDAASEEFRALMRDVASDSAARASLLQDGATAGYMGPGKGFMLQSADGGFSMRIAGNTQFRWIWNSRDDGGASDFDENAAGFEFRRAKLNLQGNLFDKRLRYFILLFANRSGGGLAVDDVFFDWSADDNWTIRWGQFKPLFNREEIVSDTQQVAIERSFVNAIITMDRSQGVAATYRNDSFSFTAGFNDGYTPSASGLAVRNANTGFAADGTEFAATARAELLAAGDWNQFSDLGAWSSDESDFGLLIGGAVHWQDGESGTLASETETLQWTLDASAEWNTGLSAFASIIGRTLEPAGAPSVDQFGFVAQAGWNIDDQWEPFVRYEWFDWDSAFGPGTDDLSIITAGLNVFCGQHKHAMKVSADLVYGINTIPVGFAGGGLQADSAGEDGQIALRTQVQVLF